MDQIVFGGEFAYERSAWVEVLTWIYILSSLYFKINFQGIIMSWEFRGTDSWSVKLEVGL